MSGALTTGIKSIHKNGLFANHQDAFYREYVGFFRGVLYSWMLKDSDKRAKIDNGKLETLIPNKIARLVCHYDYTHKERDQFQELYARLALLEATRLLEKRNFKNAKIEEYDCTVSELIRDMSVALTVHDVRENSKDRELYRLVVAEGCSAESAAKKQKTAVAKVTEIVEKLNMKADKFVEMLLK